jgi:hypothetical protein
MKIQKFTENENNLVPDDIIDTFYKRIESRLKAGYKKDSKVIQTELDRLMLVNGRIPEKIKKLLDEHLENSQEQVEKLFYFLHHSSGLASGTELIEFLKSLSLTNDQYAKLEQIMSDYGNERYNDGRQDGLDQSY